MANLKEVLNEEFITEEVLRVLREKFSETEITKDLNPSAAGQVATILRKLNSLESQDTVLYTKIEVLEKEREKIQEKMESLLLSLHFQLKPTKAELEGKESKKNQGFSLKTFAENLHLGR